MTTTATPARASAPKRAPMDSLRKTAFWAGVLYLITFVSIPTPFILYGPVKEAGYIAGLGPDTGVIFGGLLELIVGLAGIGTAVVLYKVLKRQNQAAALGLVGSRVLEGALLFVGVASILTVVALRQAGVGADGLVIGQAFIGLYEKTFLVGGSLIPAVNALLLGTLLYKSGLVPRALPVLGLIGAPLLLIGTIGTMFGAWEAASPPTVLLVLPIAIWEFSLGVYLTVKGFRAAGLAKLDLAPAVPGA